jgi:alpha-L-fucosidase
VRTLVMPPVLALSCACALTRPVPPPPEPLAPVPNENQLRWHALETCAFVHFGVNTFTDREWGDGTEDPDLFQPSRLDCAQWARVCERAGLRGIVLTAKHHDGFCLWPSPRTEHDVASSSWRGGCGDVLRDLSEACRAEGLGFGVYLSPWDRNCPFYGDSPRYNEHYAAQLEELLTAYGPVFEVWWDGACGEGPNGKRQVYDWERFRQVVRRLQPRAVIFSDVGPDVRWIGNERGIAGETNWNMLSPEGFEPGLAAPPLGRLNEGQEDGTRWIPGECDVSIRPGWFHHPAEDGKVKTVEDLLEIWHASVGRGANLLLNLPVDRRGLVHEADAERLLEWRAALDAIYAVDLAPGALARATNVRGDHARFAPANVLDQDDDTYWATDDGVRASALELEFRAPVRFDRIRLQEPLRLGQRVRAFEVQVRAAHAWRTVAGGTTIGARRILVFEPVEAEAVRVQVSSARACPALSAVRLYLAPADFSPHAAAALIRATEREVRTFFPRARFPPGGSVTPGQPPRTRRSK